MKNQTSVKIVLHPTRSDASIFINGQKFNNETSIHGRQSPPEGREKHLISRLRKVSGVNNVALASNMLFINTQRNIEPDRWVPTVIKAINEFLNVKGQNDIILEDQRFLAPPIYDENEKKIESGIREANVRIGLPYRVEK